MDARVLKSTPAQLRAYKNYRTKKENNIKICNNMIDYYERNKEEIKRKRRERYRLQKELKKKSEESNQQN